MKTFLTHFVAPCFFLPVFLCADTIFVDADAAGASNGSSWTDAYLHLQDALANASSGDEIWVSQGIYYPDLGVGQTDNDRNSTFQLKNGVALYGGFTGIESSRTERDFSTNETILSGDIDQNDGPDFANNSENAYHVLTGSDTDSTSLLSGFTISGGNANDDSESKGGGGLYNEQGSPSIANCIFEKNSAIRSRSQSGGAIYNSDSSPSISNCFFQNNSATNGGAISNLSSSPSFVNCGFQGNSANSGGGAVFDTSSSLSLTNCSFQGNTANSGGAISSTLASSLFLTNCIIWDNSASTSRGPKSASFHGASSSATLSHCLVQFYAKVELDSISANSGNNLAPSDPLFLSPTDLHLQPDSPAINAGLSVANSEPLDLDGNPRLVPITIDLGPYESSQISGPKLSDIYLPSPVEGETSFPFWAPNTSFFNNGIGFIFNFSAPSGSLAFNSLPTVDPDGTLRFTVPSGSAGTASFTVTVSDPSQSLPDFAPVSFDLFLGDQVYVDNSATGGNDGSSWDSAFLTLQDAIAVASPNLQIWVAKGTYWPDEGSDQTNNERTSTFLLRRDVAIYGGFAGHESFLSERSYSDNPTILSGDLDRNDRPNFSNVSENAYHVVTSSGTNSSTVLDGFTISGGNAAAPYFSDRQGGGLLNFNGTPSIENCLFQSNRADSVGGAVYNTGDSFLSLINCSFVGNHTENSGGAIYNSSSSPILINCSFQDNASFGSGGAIYSSFSSSPILVNCSFQRNVALRGNGGAIFNSLGSSPILTNCTFNVDSATYGADAIYNIRECSPVFTNCIIWDSPSQGNARVPVFNVVSPAYLNEDPSEPTYSHCLINNSGGSNAWNTALGIDLGSNIDSDPLFVRSNDGDLRLLSGSPALNVGNNAANSETLDLAGNNRIQGNTIDLGALEGAITLVNFAILFPSLDPTADDNNNGLSNYTDYAMGGDPTAPHNPNLQPGLTGNQLSYSIRNDTSDVFSHLQKSDTLRSDDWEQLIQGLDYTFGDVMVIGDQTIQTLELSGSLLNNETLFFRQEFTESAP